MSLKFYGMQNYTDYDSHSIVGFAFHQASNICILWFQVDSYTTEKALKKVKRLPAMLPQKINVIDVTMEDKVDGELETQTVKTPSEVQEISKGDEDHRNLKGNSPLTGDRIAKQKQTSTFSGGPSNWDPYSKGVSLSSLRISQLPDPATTGKARSHEDAQPMLTESSNAEVKITSSSGAVGESEEAQEIGSPKSLKDAIKPKHKRKKNKK